MAPHASNHVFIFHQQYGLTIRPTVDKRMPRPLQGDIWRRASVFYRKELHSSTMYTHRNYMATQADANVRFSSMIIGDTRLIISSSSEYYEAIMARNLRSTAERAGDTLCRCKGTHDTARESVS